VRLSNQDKLDKFRRFQKHGLRYGDNWKVVGWCQYGVKHNLHLKTLATVFTTTQWTQSLRTLVKTAPYRLDIDALTYRRSMVQIHYRLPVITKGCRLILAAFSYCHRYVSGFSEEGMGKVWFNGK
jgi:hypothetical protein